MSEPRKSWLSSLRDVPPAPPVGVTSADRGTTVLVYAIFFTMTAFVALALYVGMSFLAPRLQAAPGPKACRDDLADQCGEGEVCSEGLCVADPKARDCAADEPCGACTCIYPMTCGDEQVCRLRKPAAEPRSCSPKASEFVQEMLAYQVQCVASAGGQELSNCPTTNVKDFLLSHEKFDALLQEFPQGLVFLFPNGQPGLADIEARPEAWPDEATRKFYRAAIDEQAKTLLTAEHVVIVGRASKGNTAASFAYAQARVRFARMALLDALAKTPTERGELSKKFIEFALGAERPLTLEFFLLNQLPVISWNAESRRELSRVLETMRNNTAPSRGERKSIEEMINRSVAIFAIGPECAGGGQ